MNIKHNDLVINEKDPFASCKLDREKYAHVLTSIVDNYADGFVLAINNEWGTGKTTFVKMWQQHLKNEKFETLYFNAWENDFESNPLVAIMSELQTLRQHKNKENFKSLLENAAILSKNILPAVVKAVSKRYIDSEELVDGIVDSTEAAMEVLENEIEEYVSRKKSLTDFRKDLEEYLKNTKSEKPVIFIIDELDRCKPSYAVEVLEQMKHFFAVKGIIFVLAIDKVQLGHAVRGVYGSEQLNADEYLRRFIDIEYTLPAPDAKQFTEYLIDYFDFDKFFVSPSRRSYSDVGDERGYFRTLAHLLVEMRKPTLRQQEKIFAHARLALKTVTYGNYLFPNLFLFLIYIRAVDLAFYQAIEAKALSLDELAEKYFQLFSGMQVNDTQMHNLLFLEAQLLNMYNNSIEGRHGGSLLIRDSAQGKGTLKVKSRLDKSAENKEYTEIINYLYRDPDKGRTSIEHLLKKINLIEPIVT